MATLTPPIHGGHPPKLYDYFPECAWTNRMRVARKFCTRLIADDSRTSLTLADPRTDGYPASLDPGVEKASCYLMSSGKDIAGSWTCKWDGKGTVVFKDGEGHSSTGTSPGVTSVTLTLSATYGFCKVEITDTDVADPVRNIRVYYTPYLAYLKTSEGGSSTYGFDPDFIARWNRAKHNSVRMSHWIEPFNSLVSLASDRRIDTYFTENSQDDNGGPESVASQGCSWKAIADFANQFQCDYVQIPTPHLTFDDLTDSWLEGITAYMVANCPATTKFIFSGANEVWNGFAFPEVNTYLKAIGDSGHGWPIEDPPTGRGIAPRVGATQTDRLAQAFARWCKHIFDVTKAVAPTRVLGMIDWQAAPSQDYFFPILTRILSNDAGTPITPARINYDIYSTSCYTGQYLIDQFSNAVIGTWTTQQFADYVRGDIDNRLFNGLPNECFSAAFYANGDGASWIAYEMGRHEETGLSGAARTGLYTYYRSTQCHDNVLYQCQRVRSISNSSGHGFWYHSMGFPFGLAEDWTDDGGTRPGTVGMNNEPSYLAWEEAGAVIMDNTAPIMTNPGAQAATVGTPFTLQLEVFDPDVPPQILSYTITGLPPGIGYNSVTGRVSGTPLTAGVYHVIARVDDGEGGQDTELFDITVAAAPINEQPVLDPVADQTATEGVAFNLALHAVDPDLGDTVQYGTQGLPPGLLCNLNTGVIAGVPSAGSSSGGSPPGYYTVFAAARDNHGAVSKFVRFIIHVIGTTNRQPLLQLLPLQIMTEGVAHSVQVVATDPDGDTLTYAMVNAPAGITIHSSTGVISGTPAAGTSNPIDYAATVAVTDNITAPVGMIVMMRVGGGTPVNHPPVITNPGTRVAFESLPFDITVAITDPDPGDVVTVSVSGLPPGLLFSQISGGIRISGVPPQGSGRGSAYPVTIIAIDRGGLQDSETFDLFVIARSTPPVRGNQDLYMTAQMVPNIGSGTSLGSGRQINGCLGYEIGSFEVNGASRLWDIIKDWWAYEYVTSTTKHVALAEPIEVRFGTADRWKLNVELNIRGGGMGWRWRLTDTTGAPALLPADFNILETGDGTGRGFGGDLTFNLLGDDDKLDTIRISEDGALIGQGRVATGSDWLGAAAPAANRTPRWTHGSPLISAAVTRPAAGRVDVDTLSIPLDWNLTSGRGSGASLLCPAPLGLEHRRKTRFNWPRPGIHATFSNYKLLDPADPSTAWNIVQDVLGLHLHEGFDERWILDGADGAKTWTNLSGVSLHAQFTSAMWGSVTEHAHQYLRGRSYLLAVIDTTNWPTAYKEVGVELSVNISGLGVTNGLIPAIPNTNGRHAVVAALGAGAATLQIDVTDLVTLAPPFTVNGFNTVGLTYVNGTFTFPALQYHYVSGTGDSLLIRGRKTVGTEAGKPVGQSGVRVVKTLITDGKGRCAMVLKCTGANTRAVPGYSFVNGFAVGIGFSLMGDDIDAGERVNKAFSYIGSSRNTPATFQNPGTEKATAFQKLRAGISQIIEQPTGTIGASNLFRGVSAEGVVDPDLWLQLPAYVAVGSFTEVQAHMEWLFTEGWLELPLLHTKYRTVQ